MLFAVTWACAAIADAPTDAPDAEHQAEANAQQKLSRKERRKLRKEKEKQAQQAFNARLDWYPLNQLSPAQLASTPPYCDGAYLEPRFRLTGEAYNLLQPGLVVEGSDLTEKERSAREAAGAKDNTQLQANQLVFTQGTNTAVAKGNIELRDQGMLIRGSAATYNTETGKATIENADFLSHKSHIRGHADEIRRESDTLTRMLNARYTQCAPSSNTWLMKAGAIEIDQGNNMGTAKHAVLKVKDVPIFYAPWLTFPINNERRSGLLFPNISTSTNSGGLDFSIPWYWNIAPNWDATLAGRYIASRGIAAEGQLRYLNRYSEWAASGSYIDDQDFGDKRWYFGLEERGNLPNHWDHRIDYTEVSDDDYLNDLSGATSLDFKRSTNLEQSGYIRRLGAQTDFKAEVVQYQIIDTTVTEQYRRLPQLWVDFKSTQFPFKPSWLVEAQATNFEINDKSRAAGGRVYMAPGVAFPMAKSWGYLNPTVKLKAVTYALDDSHALRPGDPDVPDDNVPVENTSPSTVTPMLSIDSGLLFERPTNWFGKRYSQTLEPRLFYLYNKYEDQSDQPTFDTGFNTFDYNQLFRETRFTGYDRIADANQMSLGLSTRLIQDDSGTETVWASIGQIYYFADRRVTLDKPGDTVNTETRSPIAAEIGYQWTRNLRSYGTAQYDRNIEETDGNGDVVSSRSGFREAGFQARYFGDTGLIVNLGYRYRVNQTILSSDAGARPQDDYINQTDLSTIFPVNRHWALIGRYNYDHTNNRNLGEVLGFEFNSCCWKTRVVYQSGLDTSGDTQSGLYFQIVLKGLGGADTGVNSILEDSIVSYEDYEERDHY